MTQHADGKCTFTEPTAVEEPVVAISGRVLLGRGYRKCCVMISMAATFAF